MRNRVRCCHVPGAGMVVLQLSKMGRVLRAALSLGALLGVVAVCTGGIFALLFGVVAREIVPFPDSLSLIGRAGLLFAAGGVFGAFILRLLTYNDAQVRVKQGNLRLAFQVTFVAVVIAFFYSQWPPPFGRVPQAIFVVSMCIAALSGGQMYGDIVYRMFARNAGVDLSGIPASSEERALPSDREDWVEPSSVHDHRPKFGRRLRPLQRPRRYPDAT